jgi:hypothetical protein
MKKVLYIKPAEGLTIPDPARGRHLPSYGDSVEDGAYWRRRLREGSVLETTKEAVEAGAAAVEKARLEAEAKAAAEAAETAAQDVRPALSQEVSSS